MEVVAWDSLHHYKALSLFLEGRPDTVVPKRFQSLTNWIRVLTVLFTDSGAIHT